MNTTAFIMNKTIPKENAKAINKFGKLIEIGNKVEEKLEKYQKEKKFQSQILELVNFYKNLNLNLIQIDSNLFPNNGENQININEHGSKYFTEKELIMLPEKNFKIPTELILFDNSISEAKNENANIIFQPKEINLIKAGKSFIWEKKIEYLKDALGKIQKNKKDTINFCADKIQMLSKEVSVFQNLDSSRLLFLIRKVRKLKELLIELVSKDVEDENN